MGQRLVTSVLPKTNLPKPNRPFERLVALVWSSCSHGPKRLTFHFWVLWKQNTILENIESGSLKIGHAAATRFVGDAYFHRFMRGIFSFSLESPDMRRAEVSLYVKDGRASAPQKTIKFRKAERPPPWVVSLAQELNHTFRQLLPGEKDSFLEVAEHHFRSGAWVEDLLTPGRQPCGFCGRRCARRRRCQGKRTPYTWWFIFWLPRNQAVKKYTQKQTLQRNPRQTNTDQRTLKPKQKFDKQANKQTYIHTQTHTHTHKQINKQTNKQTNEQTNKQANNQTNKQTSKQAIKQTSKPTNKQ